MKQEMQEISVCLNDIPREKMRKGNNGKIYFSLTIAKRKEPDQWKRDLKVYISQSKEDREKNVPKIYVGGGKTITFESQEQEPPTAEEMEAILNNNECPY